MVLNKRYFLRPRTRPPQPQPRKRRAKTPKKRRIRTPSTPSPPSIPLTVNNAKSRCRTCSPIPGHLKPLELSWMSIEDRRRTIDEGWDLIESQGEPTTPPPTEGMTPHSALPFTPAVSKQAHRFTVRISPFGYRETYESPRHRRDKVRRSPEVFVALPIM